MQRFRIFLSYSHKDKHIAQSIAEHLEKHLETRVLWDPYLPPGAPFSEKIKEMISFAHIMMPLITKGSVNRPWVHQEIGYATALGIPVLPVVIDQVPKGMMGELQAIVITADKPSQSITKRITRHILDHIVYTSQDDKSPPTLQCAYEPEDRTEMLYRYAASVLRFGESGKIRHASAFGTFSLPTLPPWHETWERRDPKRSSWLRDRFLRERIVFERHARDEGCDLIIDPFPRATDQLEASARAVRVKELLTFIQDMDDNKLRVVIRDGENGNLIIVGDWFTAETISPSHGKGFRQTIFNRHGPTVLSRMKQFDMDFEELLKAQGISGKDSRQNAIDRLTPLLKTLEEQARHEKEAKEKEEREKALKQEGTFHLAHSDGTTSAKPEPEAATRGSEEPSEPDHK